MAANLPEETRRSQVKVLRPYPAEPGAEAQIDYGRLGRWLDPAGGKPVTIWAFVMVLACSRASADVAVDIFRFGWPWLGGGDPGPGYRRVDDAVLQP